MTAKEIMAMILLERPAKIREIVDELVKAGIKDIDLRIDVGNTYYSEDVEQFVGLLMQFNFARWDNKVGYILTQEGKELCGQVVAEALFREKFGEEKFKECFPNKLQPAQKHKVFGE
jgi:hypothetical protein